MQKSLSYAYNFMPDCSTNHAHDHPVKSLFLKIKYLSHLMGKPTIFAVSAFVFARRIVQSLYFLNPKFPASSYLLCLYSLVCLRPVRRPLGILMKQLIFLRKAYLQCYGLKCIRMNNVIYIFKASICYRYFCYMKSHLLNHFNVRKYTCLYKNKAL